MGVTKPPAVYLEAMMFKRYNFLKKLVHYNKVIITSTLGDDTYNYACPCSTLLQPITFPLFMFAFKAKYIIMRVCHLSDVSRGMRSHFTQSGYPQPLITQPRTLEETRKLPVPFSSGNPSKENPQNTGASHQRSK